MMQGASIYWFARGLAARKYFTTGDLARFAWQQLRFRVLAAEHAGDMSQAKDAALAFVEGWRVDDIERLTEEIFDELMADADLGRHPRARPAAPRRRPAGLAGHAAPVELGRVIAAAARPDRRARHGRRGRATARTPAGWSATCMHGPAKAEAITQLAAVEGLDLARCTAYSDSVNDMPMLSAVGHAVAVNPDSALRREARERGWEIRDFRTGPQGRQGRRARRRSRAGHRRRRGERRPSPYRRRKQA